MGSQRVQSDLGLVAPAINRKMSSGIVSNQVPP